MKKPIILPILNQKGGAGKSTLSLTFGESFARRGYKVLLIDADIQGSLRAWSSFSKGTVLPVIGIDVEGTLESGIKAIKADFDIIIIDCPPTLAAEVILLADLILIPVLPSAFDFCASVDIVSLIKKSQKVSGSPEAYFIVNKSKKNTQTSKAIVEAIKEMGDSLPYLNEVVGDRQAYVKCVPDGKTIFHSKDSEAKKAVEEINLITNQLIEVINEVQSKRAA